WPSSGTPRPNNSISPSTGHGTPSCSLSTTTPRSSSSRPRSVSESSHGPRTWGLRVPGEARGGNDAGRIVDDEQRSLGPQSPCDPSVTGTYTSRRCARDREHTGRGRSQLGSDPPPPDRAAGPRPDALQGDLPQETVPGARPGAAAFGVRGVCALPAPASRGAGPVAESAVDQGDELFQEPVLFRLPRGE